MDRTRSAGETSNHYYCMSRLKRQYSTVQYSEVMLKKEPGFGPYFETCLSILKGQWIPEFADLMVNELRMILRDEDRTLDQCSLSPEVGVELMRMFIDQKITWSTLKQVS